jgi:hypothetical protein
LSAPFEKFCLYIPKLETDDNLRKNNFTCFANMASQVNGGIWTQDVQKEGAKENTWTYGEEIRGGTERTD